jgi:AbrB family looped-hinge helix DNA binding protein
MKEHYTVVTRKGQITVPADVRRALGLRVGDRVAVSLDEDGERRATVRPVPSIVDATFGAFHSGLPPADEGQVREAFTEQAAARDERTKRT